MTGRLKSLEWKNNVLYLLDQRKLPQKQEYLACAQTIRKQPKPSGLWLYGGPRP